MAITVPAKAQSGSASTQTLAITTPTAGNLLYACFQQTGSVLEPTAKDNQGTTGWASVQVSSVAFKALTSSVTSSMWLFTKTATGGEEKLEPTAGTGGTIQGLNIFELAGATATIDATEKLDQQASGTTAQKNLTLADAGSIVLLFVADGAAASGTVSGEASTPIATTTTRCMGGHALPAKTGATGNLGLNWATPKGVGGLWIALKPTASTTGAAMFM